MRYHHYFLQQENLFGTKGGWSNYQWLWLLNEDTMVSHIRGPGFSLAARPASYQNLAPTSRKDVSRSEGKKDVVGPDFELALKSLENAKSHLKSARAYFQNSYKARS